MINYSLFLCQPVTVFNYMPDVFLYFVYCLSAFRQKNCQTQIGTTIDE